ncbi:TRAFAC clade GTPase domain-containing protein [Mastigocoleus testarum]|uniref:Double-GTPase 2 domain-containing protein n=1 Tax=Mastigocoleus testarum BC008 TaxID=371196 RepID=A0A0V7ZVB5_9CYAN|nr:hypothetical protein [Mastigocoleus testarum]KST68588.1 hypothetical protein BC008_33595 [Mastigocoleus testarum BC008]
MIPNFSIVMLGGSGAGKTIYLSCLYNKLKILQLGSYYLFLESNGQRENSLEKVFETLVSPSENWPDGTRSTQIWFFNCYLIVPGENRAYKACKFSYIDYAGGTFIEGNNERLKSQIASADVLLCLLDGAKLLDFIEDKKTQDHDQFLYDLRKMLQEITQNDRHSLPVHFIISKWDYIKELSKFSLQDINKKLKSDIPEFDKFLQARDSPSTTRLIPISALGRDFVDYRGSRRQRFINKINKMIRKKINMTMSRKIEALNIEIPLAYILIDVLQGSLDKYENKQGIKLEEITGFRKFILSLRSSAILIYLLNPLSEFLPNGFQWISVRILEEIFRKQSNDSYITNEKRKALLKLVRQFKDDVQNFEISPENKGSILKK